MYYVIEHMISKYIADHVLLQHGYTVLKDTHTICYITRYTTIYIVDRYSNKNEDLTKPKI